MNEGEAIYKDEALFFVLGKRCVVIPTDVYEPGQVLNAMMDCQRVFGLPAVGVINSRAIVDFCGLKKEQSDGLLAPMLASQGCDELTAR
jgi:hypothetical protein